LEETNGLLNETKKIEKLFEGNK